MLFKPTYHAIFDIEEPIYPSDVTTPRQWFGDQKLTIERTFVYYALQKYVRQGCFLESGRYLIRMRRTGLYIRGNLFKFPVDAPLERIVSFLEVLGIDLSKGVQHHVSTDTPEADGPGTDRDPGGASIQSFLAQRGYGHPN